MAELMHRVGPFRLETEAALTPFESLVRAIVYQQLSGRSAAAIHARVCALFRGRITASALLATSDTALRAAGLSAAKLLAVKDLADKQRQGVVPTLAEMQSLGDEEIIRRVTTVRGIGRWTVEILLIHRLGRADVLPVDDFGIRQGYRLAYGLHEAPKPRELAAIGQALWAPYRSVAAWYLWRATDSVDWAAARAGETPVPGNDRPT